MPSPAWRKVGLFVDGQPRADENLLSRQAQGSVRMSYPSRTRKLRPRKKPPCYLENLSLKTVCRRAATIFQVRPRRIYTRTVLRTSSRTAACPSDTSPVRANSPPQEALSPERVSCDRCTSRQGIWRETPYKGASRPIFRTLKKASQPFRRGKCVRHHPLTRQRVASAFPRAPPRSTVGSRQQFPRLST